MLRHTKDDGANDPPVVGLAGPFKLGKIGRTKQKAAILARMRFFKSDIDRVKRYPRVSVEYWFKKSDPTSGFFDPISLLGAETPELDLGMRYSRQPDPDEVCSRFHRTVEFGGEMDRVDYAAEANAGGANTFVPGMGGGKEKKKDGDPMQSAEYDRDGQQSNGPLSAAAIAQLTQALRPVMKEIVMEMVPVPQPPSPEQNEAVESFSADSDGANDAAPDGMAGAEQSPADSAPAGKGLNAEADSDGDSEGDGDTDFDAAGDSGDKEGGKDASAGAAKKTKSSNSPKPEAEAMADSTDKNKGKAKYSADLSGEFTRVSSEAPANLKTGDGIVARYEKLAKQAVELIDSLGVKLDAATTERDELRAKYEKSTRESADVKAELAEMRGEFEVIKAESRHNARYSKLQDLATQGGYVIDIDEELKEFATADDAAFDRHINRIKSKYQRVPLKGLPVGGARHEGPRDGEATLEEREKFAKEAASEVAAARRNGDRNASYETALKAKYAAAKKLMPV